MMNILCILRACLKHSISQVELSRNMGRPAAKFKCRPENIEDDMSTAKGSLLGSREAIEGTTNPRQKV